MGLAVLVVAALDGRVLVAEGAADGGEDVVEGISEREIRKMRMKKIMQDFFMFSKEIEIVVRELTLYVERYKLSADKYIFTFYLV